MPLEEQNGAVTIQSWVRGNRCRRRAGRRRWAGEVLRRELLGLLYWDDHGLVESAGGVNGAAEDIGKNADHVHGDVAPARAPGELFTFDLFRARVKRYRARKFEAPFADFDAFEQQQKTHSSPLLSSVIPAPPGKVPSFGTGLANQFQGSHDFDSEDEEAAVSEDSDTEPVVFTKQTVAEQLRQRAAEKEEADKVPELRLRELRTIAYEGEGILDDESVSDEDDGETALTVDPVRRYRGRSEKLSGLGLLEDVDDKTGADREENLDGTGASPVHHHGGTEDHGGGTALQEQRGSERRLSSPIPPIGTPQMLQLDEGTPIGLQDLVDVEEVTDDYPEVSPSDDGVPGSFRDPDSPSTRTQVEKFHLEPHDLPGGAGSTLVPQIEIDDEEEHDGNPNGILGGGGSARPSSGEVVLHHTAEKHRPPTPEAPPGVVARSGSRSRLAVTPPESPPESSKDSKGSVTAGAGEEEHREPSSPAVSDGVPEGGRGTGTAVGPPTSSVRVSAASKNAPPVRTFLEDDLEDGIISCSQDLVMEGGPSSSSEDAEPRPGHRPVAPDAERKHLVEDTHGQSGDHVAPERSGHGSADQASSVGTGVVGASQPGVSLVVPALTTADHADSDSSDEIVE